MRWGILLVPLAAAIGSIVALFLWSLNEVTQCRFEHPWLLYFLPLAGFLMGLVYHSIGKKAEGGNNLILEEIHQIGGGVPRRMAPLIFVATLLSHLFGASVGREGTGVQIGGSLASTWGNMFRVSSKERKIMLLCGVAAGFGAVFGTPLAGAIFSLEVLMLGEVYYEAFLPTLVAAAIGNLSCHAWGVKHMIYELPNVVNTAAGSTPLVPFFFFKIVLLGGVAGGVGWLFVSLEHLLKKGVRKILPYAPLQSFLGGGVIIGLVFLVGTHSYLGLGEWSPHSDDVTLVHLFHGMKATAGTWFWKLLFTAVSLAAGFKGGEVTPLFFIGAALGNFLAAMLGGPYELFTALGFVAIFAGASKTPLACTIMGAEIFGAGHFFEMGVACFVAYFCSGQQSIYAPNFSNNN